MFRYRSLVTLTVVAVAASAAVADASHYRIRVVNSSAGGDPGYFYVGGPINVELIDTGGGKQRFRVCMDPAPIDRPSCRSGRVGRVIEGVSPSRAGLSVLRFHLSNGQVLRRSIRVRRASRKDS